MELIDINILKSHAKDVTLQNGVKHRCIDSTIICELPKVEIVKCKDCEYRGDARKCVVAFAALKTNTPLFIADNRGKWFCADGKLKDGENNG